MRKRVLRVAVTAALVAVVLLAVPLALVIRSFLYADQRDALERAALAAAVRVNPDYASGDPTELPRPASDGTLGLYDTRQHRRSGTGPLEGDRVVREAFGTGRAVRGSSDGYLTAAVPVSRSERVIAVIRVASPSAEVDRQVALAWGGLIGLALIALAVGFLLARRQARLLAAPLEELSAHCRAVAAGDLNARADRSGIAEIDQVAQTHDDMLLSISDLVRRERDFSANASHQLRTPLTGLQLTLESGLANSTDESRSTWAEAVETVRRLHRTVEEVLRISRGPSQAGQPDVPVARVLDETERAWHEWFARDGRRLECRRQGAPSDRAVRGGPVLEILGVLLDNARVHGRGSVRLEARDLGDAVAFDVGDEGALEGSPERLFDRGHSAGGRPGVRPGAGIGLALARETAVMLGGRLTVSRAAPTRFTLLVPSVRVEDADGVAGPAEPGPGPRER